MSKNNEENNLEDELEIHKKYLHSAIKNWKEAKTQLGLALQQRSQALAAMPDPSTHHAQTDRNRSRGFQNQTAEAAMSLAVLS